MITDRSDIAAKLPAQLQEPGTCKRTMTSGPGAAGRFNGPAVATLTVLGQTSRR